MPRLQTLYRQNHILYKEEEDWIVESRYYELLNQNPIPTFHNLEKNYTSGYLTVPVVGAGTANTEFEVLSGMSMQYFGTGEYPYKTILKKTDCESTAAADIWLPCGYGTHAVQ